GSWRGLKRSHGLSSIAILDLQHFCDGGYRACIPTTVMAGLVPAIHVFTAATNKAWMPGTGPGMTQ
ncbi:MAG: hypothetical protein ACK4Z4_04350, partial [Ferrovibrio sp.]